MCVISDCFVVKVLQACKGPTLSVETKWAGAFLRIAASTQTAPLKNKSTPGLPHDSTLHRNGLGSETSRSLTAHKILHADDHIIFEMIFPSSVVIDNC